VALPVAALVLRFHALGLPGVWVALGLWLAARAALLGRRWRAQFKGDRQSPTGTLPEPATATGCGGWRIAGPVRPQCVLDLFAFRPACRSGREHRRPAECNKAPFMYEMKGALPGCAAPDPPVAWRPRRRAPPAGARHPRELPVSRLSPCPGVAPGWCPFPTVKLFLLPSRWSRKSLREFILGFFCVHTLSTPCPLVIRISQRLSTGLCTPHPQIIHRFPGRCVRLALSRRRSVNHPKLPSVPRRVLPQGRLPRWRSWSLSPWSPVSPSACSAKRGGTACSAKRGGMAWL